MPLLDHDLLIPIQIGKSDRPPIICIPGAGANVAYFRSLAARIGGQSSVYGFQPRGLDGVSPPSQSVRGAAEDYIGALMGLDAPTPLRVLGHSYGGWIALEMARLWHASGRPCSPVILLDCDAPNDAENPRRAYDELGSIVHLIEILEQGAEVSLELTEAELAHCDAPSRLTLLHRQMTAVKLISPRTPLRAIERMVDVFSANLNTAYHPDEPFSGSAWMIRAEDSESGPGDWRRHLRDFNERTSPGNHMTMLAERHCDSLAGIILESGFAPA